MSDADHEVVLYHSPSSRAFTAYWLLEELGINYRLETVDIRKGQQKSPEYLAINPAGKVPTVVDRGVVITENPAICIHLADRYSYGDLAPRIEDEDRGPYLKWMVYATSVVEPVRDLRVLNADASPHHHGFGGYDDMVGVLVQALIGKCFLLGDRFSAADVMLGSVISTSLFNKLLPEEPALVEYNERLAMRDAYQRAADATWPSHLFGGA